MSRSRMQKKQTDTKQSERFIETARELGCDEDEEAFKSKLKRIAKAPITPTDTKGTRAKPRSKR